MSVQIMPAVGNASRQRSWASIFHGSQTSSESSRAMNCPRARRKPWLRAEHTPPLVW
jgi:hypothetical protein